MPETSCQAAMRSSRRADRRQRVGAVLLVPAAAGEVVDDGDLVAAGREAHRRRPAEIAVAPEDEDAHETRQGSAPGGASSCPLGAPQVNPSDAWAYSGAALTVPVLASFFPEELTALRAVGLVFAVLLIAFAIWRRRSLSNGAVLLAIFGGLALAIVSGTELLDKLLSAFAFEKGNGGRILGLAVFAIAILFLLVLRALTESARMNQQLSALLEGLAWEEFREARLPGALPGQDRGGDPRLQRGRQRRRRDPPDPARGLRGADRDPGGGRRLAATTPARRRRRRAPSSRAT